MSEYAFRQMIRDEVVGWLAQQKGMLDVVILRIADVMSPAIADECKRKLLVRLAELQPDERELTLTLLQHFRTWYAELCLPEGELRTRGDKLRHDFNEAIRRLESLKQPAKSE